MNLVRNVSFSISKGPHVNGQLMCAITIKTGVPRAMVWVWASPNPDGVEFDTNAFNGTGLSFQPPETIAQGGGKGSALIIIGIGQSFYAQTLQCITDANGDLTINACVATVASTDPYTGYIVVSQDASGLFVSRQLTANDWQN